MAETSLRKTFKYKLTPTPNQEQELARALMLCRQLYNAALEQRITAYQRRHASVSRYEQEAELKDSHAAFPAYEAIHSHILQDVLARRDKTYQAFFHRIHRGEKAGFPRFKPSTRYRSFTFKEYGNGARPDNGVLVLSKMGRIRVHWSRPSEGTPKTVTPKTVTPKTVTIAHEADGWYVAISGAAVPADARAPTGQATGIDMGVESFATLAHGQRIFTPGYYHKAEAYLRRCQRRGARRTQGSPQRAKAVTLLARAHHHLTTSPPRHIANQRRDFQHKEAAKLVKAYATIAHEDLQTATRLKNHHLAKSIADAGWSAFLSALTFKAGGAGKRVDVVAPAYTSQACSGCGVIVQQGFSVRWHSCPECGTSLHRDHHAALNILRLAQAQRSRPG
jgi:putative transposase